MPESRPSRPTDARQALLQLRLREEARRRARPRIRPARRDGGRAPLSFAQERLWFLDQWAPGLPIYHSPLAVRLRGELNVTALEAALNGIVARHEILRTTYQSEDGVPSQVIQEPAPQSLPVLDLSDLAEPEGDAELERVIAEEGRSPFQLDGGPVLRWSLIRCGDDDHVLVLTAHHIAMDGWSMEILTNELATLYRAGHRGTTAELPLLEVQYADYAIWQREWQTPALLEEQMRYWAERLRNLPVLELPTDHQRPPEPSYRGEQLIEHLAPELASQLHELARQEGVSLFVLMLAAFKVVLHRYTGQEDVVVGSAFAGRTQAEVEPLIGFFVNMLVLRTDLSGNPSFRELLGRVRETVLGGISNQDVPFDKLVEELRPSRDAGRNPLFQVSFTGQVGASEWSGLPALEAQPLLGAGGLQVGGTSRFDLSVAMTELPAGAVELWVEFSSDLFERPRIQRLMGHLETLLRAAVADPSRAIGDLDLLTEAERQQQLAWNSTERAYPAETTVQAMVEARAAARPDSVAASCDGHQLTYGELNRRANQVAHRLRDLKVGPGVIVGVCLERSLEVPVALLGVLKAGAAYLPLDPTHPIRRLEYQLDDAGVEVLVTTTELESGLPGAGRAVVRLDREAGELAALPGDNREPASGPGDLAYVIYTSGSTGRPKGVLIEQRSLVQFLVSATEIYGVTDQDTVLQFAALTFDVSVLEIFVALTAGARLCLVPKEILRQPAQLAATMRRERVTVIDIAPAVMRLLDGDEFPDLRMVIVGGETFPGGLVDRWNLPGRRFFNVYGPTEATIAVTARLCPHEPHRESPPIGEPMPNHQLWLLDTHLSPVPVGVPGEIWIGGVGLARGYLGRPDLTQERFREVPVFGGQVRLYRSGDLGRWTDNGEVVFLGRVDQQVKIRGLRIELEEIEAVLNRHPDVAQAVVAVKEPVPGDQRLVAYPLFRAGVEVSASALRQHLQDELPDYMVPTAFVPVTELPLTTNGKVDRDRLPTPGEGRPSLAEGYLAPRTETERVLAELVFGELLGISRVGVEDSFFELGGSSLRAIQAISRIRDAFGVEVDPRAFYRAPTVAGLAEVVDAEPSAAGLRASLEAEIAQLTEEEALALLEEGLRRQERP